MLARRRAALLPPTSLRDEPQFLRIGAGTIIEDFEAGWAAFHGTGTADLVNVQSGSQSMKLTTPSGDFAAMDKTIALVLFATNDNLLIRVYVPTVAPITSLVFYFAVDSGFVQYFNMSVVAANLVNGWNTLDMHKSKWTAVGGASWASTMVRMRCRVNAAASSSGVASFDGLEAAEKTQAAVHMTFDDGYINTHQVAFPYLRARGIPATAFIISNLIDNGSGVYLTSPMLRELDRAGWNICNHTQTHPVLTSLTQAQCEAEFTNCRIFIQSLGLVQSFPYYVAYPQGAYNATVLAAMTSQSMLFGRAGVAPFYLRATNPYTVPSFDLQAPSTLEQAKAAIDTAIAGGYVGGILIHKLVEGVPASNALEFNVYEFRALIEYIRSKRLPFLTTDNVYQLMHGNVTVRAPA